MTVSSAGPDAAGDSVIVDSDDLSPLLARFSEHQQFTHVKLLLAGISLKDSLDLLFIPKLDRTRKNHQADDTHMYLSPTLAGQFLWTIIDLLARAVSNMYKTPEYNINY